MPAVESIPQHALGKNGPLVPALGFGLMGLSHSYGTPPSDEERYAVLDRAIELGSTFWDSSDLYDDNEDLLGRWFKRTGKRDQIFLATKFGFVKDGQGLKVDTSAEYCKAACAKSLARLGVDSIDLYYAHNINPETPIEETMRGLAQLKAEGKIKNIGLCGVTSTTLRRAYKIAPVAAIQAEYSVFDRKIEGPESTNLLATCRELGVAVVVGTPLGRGILTTSFSNGDPVGEGDTRSQFMPRFQKENRDRNVAIVGNFKRFADKKGCTVSQLALAWLLKQGDDIFPIPGTKRINYLGENWGSLDVSLTSEEEAELRASLANVNLAGGSVPEQFAGYIYRDTEEESI